MKSGTGGIDIVGAGIMGDRLHFRRPANDDRGTIGADGTWHDALDMQEIVEGILAS